MNNQYLLIQLNGMFKMNPKTIAQGAEAILMQEGSTLVKDRIKKSYRHEILDKQLRKRRTKSEAKIMQKLAGIIAVPKILKVKENEIDMQFIQGKVLSQHLDSFSKQKQKNIAQELAREISKIHAQNIVHGDLTTSNLILNEKENKIYFIDFGLAFHSAKIEDKAVDIHLLKEALQSKHFRIANEFYKNFLKEYGNGKGKEVIARLEQVEKRGRYKRKGML